MGDVAKFFQDAVKNVGDFFSNSYDVANKVNEFRFGTSGFGDDVKNFIDDEVVNKSDLRGAQVESFISGLPFAGDFLRGIEGVTRLEDLYNRTGKIPAYPASQGVGGASLGYGASSAIQKIADGKHDLYEFYSGTPDDFRSMMNNMYG